MTTQFRLTARAATLGIVLLLVGFTTSESTAQSATLGASKDASISRDWNNACGALEGGLDGIDVHTRAALPNRLGNGVLYFDLSTVPVDFPLSNAKLRLYALVESEYADNAFNVSRLTEPWDELSTNWCKRDAANNWATAGGSFSVLDQSSVVITGKLGSGIGIGGPHEEWIEWDVTALVESWLGGAEANHGFLVWQTDIGNSTRNQAIHFASREYADAALRPQLVLTPAPCDPEISDCSSDCIYEETFAIEWPLLAEDLGLLDDECNTPGQQIPERWGIAMVRTVLCNAEHPHHDKALQAYADNLLSLQNESAAVFSQVEPFQHVLAALLLVNQSRQNHFKSLFDLQNEYQIARQPSRSLSDEIFSEEGDLDGDGASNLEEFENVFTSGGSVEEFADASSDPNSKGLPLTPVSGTFATIILTASLLLILHLKRKSLFSDATTRNRE